MKDLEQLNILSITLHFMALQDNEIEAMGKKQGLRINVQRGMAHSMAGQLPVPAEQPPTGTIIVKEIKTAAHALRLYARISSSDQRKDLEAQLRRLVVYAYNRLTIVQAVPEGGCGTNGATPSS